MKSLKLGLLALLTVLVLSAPAAAELSWRAEPIKGLEKTWVTDAIIYQGATWVATGNQGVFKWKDGEVVEKVTEPLPHKKVLSLAVFEEKLWVGTLQGLAVFDGSKWETIPDLNRVRLSNCSLYVSQDEERLWMEPLGLAGRLMVKEKGQEKWKIFDPEFGGILNNVTAVIDLGNPLLGTTASGVYFYRDGQRSVITKSQGLVDDRITGMVAINSNLVLGHPTGISLLQDNEWKPYEAPGETQLNVTCLETAEVDGTSHLFIGQPTGVSIDRQGGGFFQVNEENGLPNNRVVTIRNVNGDIWVGTTRGAARLILSQS